MKWNGTASSIRSTGMNLQKNENLVLSNLTWVANTSTKSLLKSSLLSRLKKWSCRGLMPNLSPQKSEQIKF